MKVSQFEGVKNQFLVETENGVMFQSYDSPIAFREYGTGVVHLSEDWNYSRTTAKYLNRFLNTDKKEILAKIKEGSYKLDLGLDGKVQGGE